MNLIKKYKPTNFDEFIIDKSLYNILNTLIKTGNLNILFNGDHSTGKTTLINIIIKQYYSDVENIKDIDNLIKQNTYKINSLSDLGITLFRQHVKSFCQTSTNIPNKKKFVIIDEIDNLNNQNQQVLRSCIDKYSHNINFICSCVNIQKVLDNIQSRLIIINLPKLDLNKIHSIFSNIIKNENINIKEEYLYDIYKLSNYNLSIIYNNIQKLLLTKKDISNELIMNICTNINYDIFENYISFIKSDYKDATKTLYSLYNNGFSVNDILESLFEYIKFNKNLQNDLKFEIFTIIGKYISNFYTIHEEKIELFLLSYELNNIFRTNT